MLMTVPASILNSVIEQTEKLKSEILSSTYDSTLSTYDSMLHEPSDGCKTYYISPDGCDSNDGRSPDSAWQTLDALTANHIEPGSEVLFERGGIWRGSFKACAGVTYSAYGDGDKPRIYGSPFDGAKTGEWVEVAPDIYRYSEKLCGDCGCIVMDNGAAHALKLVVNYEGEQPVDNVTKAPFNGYTDLVNDLQFWHDLGSENIYNPDGGYIYLCSKAGNPAKRFSEIEFLNRGNIISIGGEGVTIDNLTIMYGGCHGIGSGTTKNLTVTNCVLGWIGGSLQYYRNGRPVRFGNGVEIYGGCDNYVIDHCYVYQIYDAGITHQLSSGGDSDCTMSHMRYTNNLIEYCTYSIEYFLGKAERESAVRWMADIDMRNNILRFAGYGWGDQRPDKTSPAHFKGWDHYNRLIGSFTIEDNIVECSKYMMIHCGTGDDSWNPILRGNTFIQYTDGQFGRYGKYPTELLMYNEQVLSREEFVGNEFYII